MLGPDLGHPEHAAVGALVPGLAGREQPRDCRHVDIGPDADLDQVLAAMVSRLDGPPAGPLAVRGDQAWARGYDPCPVPDPEPAAPAGPGRVLPPVLPGDTVLIIGGLAGPGLALARRLADRYHCRLVLTARPAGTAGGEHAAGLITELERLGAATLVLAADPADGRAMRDAVRAAVDAFGDIDVAVWADPDADAGARGFRVLQSALARRAGRRLLLSPPGAAVLAAYAQQARARGAGRWTVIEPAGPVPADDLAEAADALLPASHLGHVLIGTGTQSARGRAARGQAARGRAASVCPAAPARAAAWPPATTWSELSPQCGRPASGWPRWASRTTSSTWAAARRRRCRSPPASRLSSAPPCRSPPCWSTRPCACSAPASPTLPASQHDRDRLSGFLPG